MSQHSDWLNGCIDTNLKSSSKHYVQTDPSCFRARSRGVPTNAACAWFPVLLQTRICCVWKMEMCPGHAEEQPCPKRLLSVSQVKCSCCHSPQKTKTAHSQKQTPGYQCLTTGQLDTGADCETALRKVSFKKPFKESKSSCRHM